MAIVIVLSEDLKVLTYAKRVGANGFYEMDENDPTTDIIAAIEQADCQYDDGVITILPQDAVLKEVVDAIQLPEMQANTQT